MISQPDELKGDRILGIRRIRFIHRGEINEDSGPLELATERHGVVVFGAGPDGESLVLSNKPWADPFDRELSAKDREWVEVHGKWTAFSISGEEPWADLVGHRIDRVLLRVAEHVPSEIVGADLETERGTVRVDVVADELKAHVGGN